MLNLSPLCGGLPPDIAWPYLTRVGDVLASAAPHSDAGAGPADTLGTAFDDLISTKGQRP
jgi:hypothetical protein